MYPSLVSYSFIYICRHCSMCLPYRLLEHSGLRSILCKRKWPHPQKENFDNIIRCGPAPRAPLSITPPHELTPKDQVSGGLPVATPRSLIVSFPDRHPFIRIMAHAICGWKKMLGTPSPSLPRFSPWPETMTADASLPSNTLGSMLFSTVRVFLVRTISSSTVVKLSSHSLTSLMFSTLSDLQTVLETEWTWKVRFVIAIMKPYS